MFILININDLIDKNVESNDLINDDDVIFDFKFQIEIKE